MQSARRNRELLLLGHRGARRYAPENTLEAFNLALEHGCHGFEFDVRRTFDGHAVICHDPHHLGREIASCNYSELIEADPSLTSLDAVIGACFLRAFLYIELKVGGLADKVVTTLRAHPPQKGYAVASFLPEVLAEVHACDPNIPLGLIADRERNLALWPQLPLSFVMPNYRLAIPELVQDLHQAGKRVLVWTVNDQKCMREMSDVGVDGIVSDDTLLLCRTFRQG